MNQRFPVILAALFAFACAREAPTPVNDTATTTAITTVTDTAPPLTPQRVGPPLRHYRLWSITPLQIQEAFPFPQPIQLDDTLTGGGPWSATVIEPGNDNKINRAYVANPVRKTHGPKTFGYENNDPHYVMYVVRSTHVPPAQALVKNQFTQQQTQTWKLKKEYRLLVSAAKSLNSNVGAPPLVADHFICVGVDTKINAEANITLVDQFQDRIETNMDGSVRLTPKYFCAAASKEHGGPWIQARNPEDRLAIYELSQYATAKKFPVWTNDQIARLTFEVERGDLLAVPQDPPD